MSSLRKSLFVVTLVCGVGCITKVAVPRTAPGEIALPGVTSIGLARFDGSQADIFRVALAERLVDAKCFAILDDTQTEAAVKELKKTTGKDFKRNQTIFMGGLDVATAIITGTIHPAEYTTSITNRAETCKELKLNGKFREYPCVRQTRRAKASCAADMRLQHTTTGRILASKELRASKAAKTESTKGDAKDIDRDELLKDCRSDIVDKFVRYIAPHEVKEEVVLEEDSDLPSLATGNLYAQGGSWEKALGFYEQALSTAREHQDKLNPETVGRAYYAVGLGRAMLVDYDTSLQLLDKAVELHPYKAWVDFQVRVQAWQRDTKILIERAGASEPRTEASRE